MSELNELRKQIEDFKTMIKVFESVVDRIDEDNKPVRFEHTHAYYRSDLGKWVSRWNARTYKNQHIGYHVDKESAVISAKEYNEIAEFVLEAHREAGQ